LWLCYALKFWMKSHWSQNPAFHKYRNVTGKENKLCKYSWNQTTVTSTHFCSASLLIQRTASARSQIELLWFFLYGLVGNKWHLINENDSFYYNTQYMSHLNALYFGARASRKLSSEQQKLVKQKVTGLNLSVVDWKIWYREQEPPRPRQEHNSPYVLTEGSGWDLGNRCSAPLSLLVH